MSTRPAPLPLDSAAIEAAVTAATAGPSILNSQPWRFHAHGDRIDVFAVPERAPALLDPAGREVFISVGAAVLNLRLAIEAAGRAAVVELAPSTLDRRFAATVRVAGPVGRPSRTERCSRRDPAPADEPAARSPTSWSRTRSSTACRRRPRSRAPTWR